MTDTNILPPDNQFVNASAEAVRLLQRLGRGGEWRYLWIKERNGTKRTVWQRTSAPITLPQPDGADVYFSVNPSDKAGTDTQRALAAPTPKKPGHPLVAVVNCLYAEYDNVSLTDVLAQLKERGVPEPSTCVFSGGGIHAYWFLTEPLRLTPENRSHVMDAQAGWNVYVGGEKEAKDIARILRLPGTVNCKPERASNGKPPTVRVVLERDHEYTFAQLDSMATAYVPVQAAKEGGEETMPTLSSATDIELWDLMLRSKNGADIGRLKVGDLSGYVGRDGKPNHSSADIALCNHLAFWTGKDAGRMDRMFRQSKLARHKWEREDYRNMTIDKAIAGCSEVYTPHAAHSNGSAPPVNSNHGFDAARQMATSDELEKRAAAEAGLPEVVVNNRQLADLYAETMRLIEARNAADPRHPMLFVRYGTPVRVGEDEDGRPRITDATTPVVRHMLGENARWVKVEKSERTGSTRTINVYPPRDLAETIVSAGEWNLPPLSGVISHPVYSTDWQLQVEQGYDSRTRLHLDSDWTGIGDIDPTPQNVTRAIQILRDELLTDFPFVDQASEAHALALLLLPIVRPAIIGPTPGALVTSPSPGTGKGLLVEAATRPFHPYGLASSQITNNEEETRKLLTSILRSGRSCAFFDNVNVSVSSAALAAAMTQAVWSDRLLGRNEDVTIPIHTCWILAANNPTLSSEITRRCVHIRIDANTPDPSQREGFKHDPLIEWIKENTRLIVWSAIVLVENWKANGRPPFKGRPKGSFEAWARTIGGILQAAGIEGFLGNESELRESSRSEAQALTAFCQRMWEVHKTDYCKAKELMPIACGDGDGDGDGLLLDVLTAKTEQGRLVQLAKWLSSLKDRVVDIAYQDPTDDSAPAPAAELMKLKVQSKGKRGNVFGLEPVSYTHLTLPTNREV